MPVCTFGCSGDLSFNRHEMRPTGNGDAQSSSLSEWYSNRSGYFAPGVRLGGDEQHFMCYCAGNGVLIGEMCAYGEG